MAITPINPNDPSIISGTTNTHDPRWIDWGPDHANPTFNIDDAKMWLPMTVISGLASGYCERAAVVSGGRLATDVEWPETSIAGATTTRANIVSRLANNIALGTMPTAGDPQNMYVAADATYTYPVSSSTSTYMYAMDAMIGTLIGDGGFVQNSAGDTYNGNFATLAQNAAARSVDCGSNINRTITQNAPSYQLQMGISYPAKWAEERKWLLDELRWVGNSNGNKYPAMAPTYVYSYVTGSISRNTTVSVQSANDDTDTIAQLFIASASGTQASKEVSGVYALWASIPNALKQNDVVNIYLDIDTPAGTYDFMEDYNAENDGVCYVSTYTPFDSTKHKYVILTGGTLDITGTTTTLDLVEIDSGGTLIYDTTKGMIASALLLEGGYTLNPKSGTGIPNRLPKLAANVVQNYRAMINDFRNYDTVYSYYTEGSYNIGANIDADTNLYIAGATVTVSGGDGAEPISLGDIYVSNAQVIINSHVDIGGIIIDSGGYVELRGVAMPEGNDRIVVLSGGKLSAKAATSSYSNDIKDLWICGGGSCIIDGSVDSHFTYISGLDVHDNSYLKGIFPSKEICSSSIQTRAQIRHFCTLGLAGGTASSPTTDLSSGWHLFPVNNINTATSNTIYSAADATTAISTYINTDGGLNGLSDRLNGGFVVSGVTTGIEATLTNTTYVSRAAEIYYTAKIKAVNKQAGPTAATNAYPSFRCRQLYTDLPAT